MPPLSLVLDSVTDDPPLPRPELVDDPSAEELETVVTAGSELLAVVAVVETETSAGTETEPVVVDMGGPEVVKHFQ